MATPSKARTRAIHRRRRFAALVIGILIIAAAFLLIVRPWASGGSPSESHVAVPSQSPTPTPTPTPSESPFTGIDGTEEPEDVAACGPEQVEIVPATNKGSYAADDKVQLSFTIVNTSDELCELNIGTTQQVYTITSGTDTIYTSDACPADDLNDQVETLKPDQQWSTEDNPITWDRTRTGGSCDASPTPTPVPAEGATYSVAVTVSGLPSASTASFTLD